MSDLKYNVNVEKDEEGNLSGLKITWKTTTGTVIDECVVTNSEHLIELETRINEIVSNTLRPAEVLAALLKVDGLNSGLDADTFRGLLPSAFALEQHTHDTRYYTKTEIDTKLAAISSGSGSGSGSGTGTDTGSGSGSGTGTGETTPIVKTTPTVRITGPSTVALGGTYTLTASLPSDATGTVTFYKNGTQIAGTYQATVAGGSASVTNNIGSSEGSWTYTCKYNGNDIYNSADSSNSVIVQAVNTKATSLSGNPTVVNYGEYYSIYLKDYQGNPIAGQHISFACTATLTNGTVYTKSYPGTTDTNGKAIPTVPFTFTDAGFDNCIINIVSSFAGNDNYNGCSDTTDVEYHL